MPDDEDSNRKFALDFYRKIGAMASTALALGRTAVSRSDREHWFKVHADLDAAQADVRPMVPGDLPS